MMAAGMPTALDVEEGNPAQVLRAAVDAVRGGARAALAVVLETEGSTYSRTGTVALFAEGTHVGWLSGGCLEPEIARRAWQAVDNARIEWLEIDTRDDDALFSGNAVGCRGRQRVALLPLPALPGIELVLQAWLQGNVPLQLELHVDGQLRFACEGHFCASTLRSAHVEWTDPRAHWQLRWQRAPTVLLLGAGPEVGPLLPLLTGLGWRASVHDPRESWRLRSHVPADAVLPAWEPRSAAAHPPDAALVMHHNFELDRDALEQLAATAIPFIGLLGPERRREDLFKLLPAAARASLQPRLRSPIGLALGGRGPDAIALSIAAQLQAWRHGSALAAV